MSVVHVVQVVVQEEQTEDGRSLDDHRSARSPLVSLVLGEGTDGQDRQAR
jgi:hypothetical protein